MLDVIAHAVSLEFPDFQQERSEPKYPETGVTTLTCSKGKFHVFVEYDPKDGYGISVMYPGEDDYKLMFAGRPDELLGTSIVTATTRVLHVLREGVHVYSLY